MSASSWRQDPVHAVPGGGWQWGKSGKVYGSKKKAQAQARAIYAAGFKEDVQVRKSKAAIHAALSPPKAAEAKYRRELVQMFQAIHRGVGGMVTKELLPLHPNAPKEPSALHTDAPGDYGSWAQRVRSAFARVGTAISNFLKPRGGVAFDRMATAVNKNGVEAATLLGIQPKAAGIDGFLSSARAANLQYLYDAGRDYADDVRDVLLDEDNFGLDVDELADLIEERAGVSLSRAQLIATDQTLKTNAGIMRIRHEAAGVDEYIWSTVKDERVRPFHAELEGQRFSYDDPPETNEDGDTNNPGEDYRCFPADSELQFAYGAVKGFRRWYDGELAIVVVESGKTIRATPNHPVLTRRGWVALGSLKIGDHVVEIADEALATSRLDENYRVPSIGDAFASLSVFGIGRTARSHDGDFHGDGREGDVHVVHSYRPLMLGLFAEIAQSGEDLQLTESDPATLALGAHQTLSDGLGGAAYGGVGRTRDRGTLFGGRPGESQEAGFRPATNLDASRPEPRFERDAFDAGSVLDREQTLAGIVGCDDGGHLDLGVIPRAPSAPVVCLHADSAEFLAQVVGVDVEHRGYIVQGLPARQKFARVVRVDRLPFHGWVLNMETLTGWYATQGVLAHNCRCVAVPVLPDDEEESESEEETPDEAAEEPADDDESSTEVDE